MILYFYVVYLNVNLQLSTNTIFFKVMPDNFKYLSTHTYLVKL